MSHTILFYSPQQSQKTSSSEQALSHPIATPTSQQQRPQRLPIFEDVNRNNDIAETILLSGSLNRINSLNHGSPPVILSPPPLPDRQPTMEKIWHTQSPRRTPTASPRGSPFGSPRASPCPSPGGSPSLSRKQSPEELPPLPKPYNGNSSLLRSKTDDNNKPLMDLNSKLPPLPARNKRSTRPLSMKSRSTAASPVPGITNCFPPERKVSSSEHAKLSIQNSFHRRTRSDDQLDRSWDASDFEESPALQRSMSVSKSKPKYYEPIFNTSSNFLFSPHFSNSAATTPSLDNGGRRLLLANPSHEESYQEMCGRESSGPIKQLDPNRPVPLPPVEILDKHVGGADYLSVQRPTTLPVIVGSRPGSVSDSEAITPTLPPKKNKTASAVRSPTEEPNLIASAVAKAVEEKTQIATKLRLCEISESDKVVCPFEDEIADKVDVTSRLKYDALKIDMKNMEINNEKDEEDDEIGEEKEEEKEENVDSSTVQRKQSEVYYPIPDNTFDRDVVACHDFYDDDDDAPWKNYDAPVPILNTPTSEVQTKWSPVGSDGPGTPSSEFAKYIGTEDPFLNDSFFNRKGDEIGVETPPSLPTRAGNACATSGVDINNDTGKTHSSENIDNLSSSDQQAESSDSDSHPPLPPTSRSRPHNTPMKFYDQDFEVLMRQGYSRGDIRRALTVANNNFSIARAILKEFTQNKP